MNEIICPQCHKAFQVDEAGFANILKQVRDRQFDEEVRNRLAIAEKEKENAVKLAEAQVRNSIQDTLARKEQEIADIKAKSALTLAHQLSQKDNTILTSFRSI